MSDTVVLRRCATCQTINRIYPHLGYLCTCGQCGSILPITHYEVLGIPKDATPGDIKLAYKKSVKVWHPDVHPNPIIAEPHFRRIVEAFETLTNPTLRSCYDSVQGVASAHYRPDVSSQPTSKSESAPSKPQSTGSDTTTHIFPIKSPLITYISLGSFSTLTLIGAILTGMSGSSVALLILLGLSVLGAVQFLFSLLKNIQ